MNMHRFIALAEALNCPPMPEIKPVKPAKSSNPMNCKNCDYFKMNNDPETQFCYMFQDEPDDRCYKFKM